MYVYDLNRAERRSSFNTKSYISFMKIKKKKKKKNNVQKKEEFSSSN